MSVITFSKLRYGVQQSQQHETALINLDKLHSLIPVITLNDRVGARYGEIRAQRERTGTPIGNNDVWIAAHALVLDVTLVTNNTREFERLPQLRLAN